MLKNTFKITSLFYFILKVILISLGIAMTGLGAALLHKSGLGSSPIDTMASGITKVLGVPLGTSSIIINCLLFIPCFFLGRDTIKTGTVLTVVTMGMYINAFGNILPDFSTLDIIWLRYLVSVVGTILCAIGIAFYVVIDEGLGPLEGITQILCDRLKWSYKNSKTTVDVVLLLLGILLGGVYGVGTLISVLFTGVLIQVFLKVFNMYFKNMLKRIKAK